MVEVMLFIFMSKLLRRFSFYSLLMITLCLTAVRWGLLAVGAEWIAVLLIVQCLHAVSFASMHALTMHWLRVSFVNVYQGKAQALYSASSYGLGGMLGALVSGFLWEPLGAYIFWVASFAVAIAALMVLRLKSQLIAWEKAN